MLLLSCYIYFEFFWGRKLFYGWMIMWFYLLSIDSFYSLYWSLQFSLKWSLWPLSLVFCLSFSTLCLQLSFRWPANRSWGYPGSRNRKPDDLWCQSSAFWHLRLCGQQARNPCTQNCSGTPSCARWLFLWNKHPKTATFKWVKKESYWPTIQERLQSIGILVLFIYFCIIY